MRPHDPSQHPVPARTVGRRPLLAGLAGGLALVSVRSGPATRPPVAHAAQATPAAEVLAPPLGETFVGPTSDPETLVAIVLRADAPGEVVAYLCRGPELNIWFTGRLQDDTLELTGAPWASAGTPTAPAASLTGRLTSEGVSGEARLLERTLTFEAIPATGLAGLYVTERDEGGGVHGASSTGATLEAKQVVADGAAAAEAPYRIVGTVTLPDGQQLPIEIPARTTEAALFRWVALADGRVRGAGKRRDGDGNGFVQQGVGI